MKKTIMNDGEIMIDIRVVVRVDKQAAACNTVEEAIEKGFIRHVKAETGSTRAEYGIAGHVDIEKAKQFALDSLIKWEA